MDMVKGRLSCICIITSKQVTVCKLARSIYFWLVKVIEIHAHAGSKNLILSRIDYI